MIKGLEQLPCKEKLQYVGKEANEGTLLRCIKLYMMWMNRQGKAIPKY